MLEELDKCIMYRSWTGYDTRCHTAVEIIQHEMFELGNDIGVDDLIFQILDETQVNGSRLIWVTKTPEDASRYGEPQEVEIPDRSIIIGEDNEGGYLVLLWGLASTEEVI